MIDKLTINKIKDRAKVEDFLTNLKPAGKDLYCKCPSVERMGSERD